MLPQLDIFELLVSILVWKTSICQLSEGVAEYSQYLYATTDKLYSPVLKTIISASKLMCGLACAEDSFCIAFSFDYTRGECRLYDTEIENPPSLPDYMGINIYSHQGCGQLPSVLNAYPTVNESSSRYPVGKRIDYSCLEGTYMIGKGESICLSNVTWSRPDFSCVFVKTCHEAVILLLDTSVPIKIKPIETGDVVTVSCEKRQNDVYTVIGHDMAARTHIKGYETPHSYVLPIEYTIPLDLAIGVVDVSAECEQFIKFECFQVGARYNSFRTRTGEQADYFAGGVKGRGDNNCACHINNACINQDVCNCRYNIKAWYEDSGYNRYKEDLPITAFLGGDTGGPTEEAYITIGSLKCKGQS